MSDTRKVFIRKQPQAINSTGRDYYDNDNVSYEYQDGTSPTKGSAVC